MSIILLVINLLLMMFTGFYVYLTHKLIKVNESTNKINNDFYLEQLRLSSMPLLAVNVPVQRGGNEVYLEIENTVNLPAFDLDIWICSVVADGDHPKKDLYKSGVGDRNIKYLKDVDTYLVDNESYSLYDRGIYAALQGNYKIKLRRTFKYDPYWMFLVLQYKDQVGNNYYQQYKITWRKEDFKILSIDEIIPVSLKPCNRFDLRPNQLKDVNIPQVLDSVYNFLKSGVYADSLEREFPIGIYNKWVVERIIN